LAAARARVADAVTNPLNTVIGVIATNARLDAGQLFRLANAAQDGLALAVRPAHGLFDGDTVFSATTGTVDADAAQVVDAATEVFARALVHGLLGAEPVGHFTAYRELYPKTARSY
jgi:putative pantetheine hydrolase